MSKMKVETIDITDIERCIAIPYVSRNHDLDKVVKEIEQLNSGDHITINGDQYIVHEVSYGFNYYRMRIIYLKVSRFKFNSVWDFYS